MCFSTQLTFGWRISTNAEHFTAQRTWKHGVYVLFTVTMWNVLQNGPGACWMVFTLGALRNASNMIVLLEIITTFQADETVGQIHSDMIQILNTYNCFAWCKVFELQNIKIELDSNTLSKDRFRVIDGKLDATNLRFRNLCSVFNKFAKLSL